MRSLMGRGRTFMWLVGDKGAMRGEVESRRAIILGTIAFFVVLTLAVLDFWDDGEINNSKFLIVALFVFSGAGTGRIIDALVDRYVGNSNGGSRERKDQ